MPRNPLIVLKFGGSVLRGEGSYRLAVHEIYRWRRRGYNVIAVVSARSGRTDELFRTAEQYGHSPDPHATAALVCTGELDSAAALSLELDRAGVPAVVLDHAAIDLRATGTPLESEPVSLDEDRIRDAFVSAGVVVIPGFIARDEAGGTVLLGRGGSDLTALFVARHVNAELCRLIKDVDGLYEWDPTRSASARPRRYRSIPWNDALCLDGNILQHKAVEYARAEGLSFQVGRLDGTEPTTVGSCTEPTFGEPDQPGRRLRVLLLGLGVVGGGVYKLLEQVPDQFEIVGVCVRDRDREDRLDVPPALLVDDIDRALDLPHDVLVEAIGGMDDACRAIERSIGLGAHVVTANKSVIAEHGHRLSERARASDVRLLRSACVAGAAPVLELLGALDGGDVRSIRAVLNGTCNYVLDAVASGVGFGRSIVDAQRLGLAEADPSRDLESLDAADKLLVIAQTLGLDLAGPSGSIPRDVLTEESVDAAARTAGQGRVLRQVASLRVHPCDPADARLGALGMGGPRIEASVRLEALAPQDPLARAAREENAAVVELSDGERVVIRGKGAGRWPTAEAVFGDLWELARSFRASGRRPVSDHAPEAVPA